jgi:hypothetical protein
MRNTHPMHAGQHEQLFDMVSAAFTSIFSSLSIVG